MPSQYLYAEYPTLGSGQHITFIVGPSDSPRRFEIHQLLLGTGSRIFNVSEGKPRIITREIHLPNTDPEVFDVMCHWLNPDPSEQVLKPTKEKELVDLMESWTVYAELRFKLKVNAIIRCGMALMQPKDFVCPVSTVEWVYAYMSPRSKLRGYTIAIFCQRGLTPTKEMLMNTDPAIFADANDFFKVLQKVRKGDPQLSAYRSTFLYPLPKYLDWGDKAQTLPDEHFFVTEADEWQEDGAVLKQLKKMVNE